MSLLSGMPKIANLGTPCVPSAPPAKSDSVASTIKMSCMASDAIADEERHEWIHMILRRQDGVGVAAHHKKASLAEGELMRIVDQRHEPNRAGRHCASNDADTNRIAARVDQRINRDRNGECNQRQRSFPLCEVCHVSPAPLASDARPNRNTPPRINK